MLIWLSNTVFIFISDYISATKAMNHGQIRTIVNMNIIVVALSGWSVRGIICIRYWICLWVDNRLSKIIYNGVGTVVTRWRTKTFSSISIKCVIDT